MPSFVRSAIRRRSKCAIDPKTWKTSSPAAELVSIFSSKQFRASGLNLIIAAIVYWSSTYIADAVKHLRAAGEVVPEALLAHTTPLSWEHIGLSGDFLWDHAAATADKRRPLNLGRTWAAA